jgi:predicted GNAT family acetyltransferase
MDQRVTDNNDRSRFEVFDGDELAGFAEYHRSGDEIAFIHTEIDPRFAVLPYCPFIRGWIKKHPDYVDLVPASHRARFAL